MKSISKLTIENWERIIVFSYSVILLSTAFLILLARVAKVPWWGFLVIPLAMAVFASIPLHGWISMLISNRPEDKEHMKELKKEKASNEYIKSKAIKIILILVALTALSLLAIFLANRP